MSSDETTKKPKARRGRRDRLAGERTRAEPDHELAPERARELHRSPHRAREIPEGEAASYYWPEGKPEPDRYVIREPIPCRACKRILTTHASQAVVCDGTAGGQVAYLRCRACGESWKLPVDRV